MAVTLTELRDSFYRETRNGKTKIHRFWGGIGATTDTDVEVAAAVTAPTVPATYATLPILDVIIKPEKNSDKHWNVEVVYGNPEDGGGSAPDVGTLQFSFKIGTQNEKIFATPGAMAGSYALTGSAPDLKGAINWDGANVNGVDVMKPTFQFSKALMKTVASVDNAYLLTLSTLVGKGNNAEFLGFAAGTLLLIGVDGHKVDSSKFEIVFSFAHGEHKTGLNIGGITGISKGAWQYLWVAFKHAAAETHYKVPSAVYVHNIYESADMSLTGLS